MTRSSGATVSGSRSISALHGAASVIMRADIYVSSGEETTAVPRSRARPSTSSEGAVPLLVTSSAAPCSIASRCASGRSPTTTTSPSAICVGESTSIECANTRPASCRSVARDQLALEHPDHGAHGGGSDERRHLAGLADVAARQRALGHDADERAVVVDDRHQVDAAAGHGEAHRPDGLLLTGHRKASLHHVARTQQHVAQQGRLGRLAALEQPARLRVHLAQPHRHVLVRGRAAA